MNSSISETHKDLTDKLYDLTETGPTALGPGITSAVGLAAQCGKGSTVILCTDGLSNVGVGSLEDQSDTEGNKFYETLAEFAKSKGVVINIISIKGEECELEALKPLFAETGGNVSIIEPDELKDNFANILKAETIATNATVKIKLHKALEFRNEDEKDMNSDQTLLIKELGNINEDSEITFEYRVKSQEKLDKLPDFDIKSLKQVPFQTIIEYTKLDGMRCIRTITKVQRTTEDANAAKEKANVEILAANAMQQASKLAEKGDYRAAQAYSISQKKFIQKAVKDEEELKVFKSYKVSMNEVYNQCHTTGKLIDSNILGNESSSRYPVAEYDEVPRQRTTLRPSTFVPDSMSMTLHQMKVSPTVTLKRNTKD